MQAPFPLNPRRPDQDFPDTGLALSEPNGLLAFGGDLSEVRLLNAYRRGIFPWYSTGQPILWWSPDPRTVLFPQAMHISRSLRKTLRQGRLTCSLDRDFAAVMRACAEPRRSDAGSWITEDMQHAYQRLHAAGHAHSVEVWEDQALVGGIYGVAIGRVFYGESMFSRRTNASKVGMAWLARQLQAWGYALMDCQVHNDHLQRLGAINIPRADFEALLAMHCEAPGHAGSWVFDIEARWR